MSTIISAANIPINMQNTSVPDVSGSLQGYFQKMVFSPLAKIVKGFQVVEQSDPIEFWGTIQPFSPRMLLLKPEGQRAWSWFSVHAEPGVKLKVDDVIVYNNVQYRIMQKIAYAIYGFEEYHMVTDWTGSGP